MIASLLTDVLACVAVALAIIACCLIGHLISRTGTTSKDCRSCGAPGPYGQHPGICWGCLIEHNENTRWNELMRVTQQLEHGRD